MGCLHTLGIILPFCGLSVHFVDNFSFVVQKLLITSHLFIVVFIFITLEAESKRIVLRFMSECSAYAFLLGIL